MSLDKQRLDEHITGVRDQEEPSEPDRITEHTWWGLTLELHWWRADLPGHWSWVLCDEHGQAIAESTALEGNCDPVGAARHAARKHYEPTEEGA